MKVYVMTEANYSLVSDMSRRDICESMLQASSPAASLEAAKRIIWEDFSEDFTYMAGEDEEAEEVPELVWVEGVENKGTRFERRMWEAAVDDEWSFRITEVSVLE